MQISDSEVPVRWSSGVRLPAGPWVATYRRYSMTAIEIDVDGETWTASNSDTAEYDAVHAVAGALLAGADKITVTRRRN